MENGSQREGTIRARSLGFAALAVAILLEFGWAAPVAGQTERPIRVSIISLIANPERYEGKLIQLQGLVTVKFELNAVWLGADSLKHLDVDNAIALRLSGDGEPEDLAERAKQYDEKFVPIVGRFTAEEHGHLSLYPGEILVERIGRVTK